MASASDSTTSRGPARASRGGAQRRHAEILVVGAGAAGAVIASRVTEDPSRDVLLLEAGPDHPVPAALPADLADGTRNSMRAHDWGLRHHPFKLRPTFPMPRGRVVGGSSAVNTCIALRGVPADYDEWAARGLPEWAWEHCLPAFVRMETDLDFGTPGHPYHGHDGPLPLRRHTPDELVPWQAGFLRACGDLGFPECPDTNAPDAEGYGVHAMNKIDGRRKSAAECWLTPAVRARDNLRLAPDTHVVRVRFRAGRAVGVDALVGPSRAPAQIDADLVVLCAGAIHTPGILLRSGVGPKRDLARMGVAPVAPNPNVGVRLTDHPGFAVFCKPKPGVCRLDAPLIQTVHRFRSTGGPMANDLQLQAGSAVPWYVDQRVMFPVVTIMGQVGKPEGVGRMRWSRADPFAKPRIDSDLMGHPTDRERATEAVADVVAALLETPTLRALATPLWPSRRLLRSRGRVRKWLSFATDSGYHPSGSVPMGADDDPAAACDGRGRVRGVEGLVVADASLMPTVPTANTHLPTLMIGERFGEWLRDAGAAHA